MQMNGVMRAVVISDATAQESLQSLATPALVVDRHELDRNS